ncbi:uncharacterized protein [Chelonus insularis]|uniref:uncharacterized protein n=1 Tax=Chelonus insularis TaxID=460826 RepID=UPI00158DE652|nr:uncharacterized protein LOC118064436 [Chelonus insularis]
MENRSKFCCKIILTLTIMVVFTKRSECYPMYQPDRDIEWWRGNVVDPMWLSANTLPDGENLQNEYDFLEIQPQRQMNFIGKPEKEVFFIEETETRSPPVIRQIDSNRLVKKDSFVSRNWGAGGLPFSVLYMNPHGSRSNQPTDPTKQADTKRPMAGVEPSVPPKNTNTRLTTRNGINVQQRRQYSIIPQLFISYGWSSLGKNIERKKLANTE